jgi:hypothetical protein
MWGSPLVGSAFYCYPQRRSMRNFLLLLLGVTACSTSQAGEAETPLAMADSARAHISRSDKAMQAGDSAAYMAEFAAEIVWLVKG